MLLTGLDVARHFTSGHDPRETATVRRRRLSDRLKRVRLPQGLDGLAGGERGSSLRWGSGPLVDASRAHVGVVCVCVGGGGKLDKIYMLSILCVRAQDKRWDE